MAENLDVPGRRSVRTPMQWTSERNAGFSSADPSELTRPVTAGRFGPAAVNVADQRGDPESLLNWFERMIRRRREVPEIGFGDTTLLSTGDRRVLAHRCDWEGSAVVAVHNFGAIDVDVTIDLGDVDRFDRVVNLLDAGEPIVPLEAGSLGVALPPFGFCWYRIEPRGSRTAP